MGEPKLMSLQAIFGTYTDSVRQVESNNKLLCQACKEYLADKLNGKIIIEKQTRPAFPPQFAYKVISIKSICVAEFREAADCHFMSVSLAINRITLDYHDGLYACDVTSQPNERDILLNVNTGDMYYAGYRDCKKEQIECISVVEFSEKYGIDTYDKNTNRLYIGDYVMANDKKYQVFGISENHDTIVCVGSDSSVHRIFRINVEKVSE